MQSFLGYFLLIEKKHNLPNSLLENLLELQKNHLTLSSYDVRKLARHTAEIVIILVNSHKETLVFHIYYYRYIGPLIKLGTCSLLSISTLTSRFIFLFSVPVVKKMGLQ